MPSSRRKFRRKINYSPTSFLLIILAILLLPLLLFAAKLSVELRSKAASNPSFAQAARITTNDSGIYAPPILPSDVMTFEAWVRTDDFTNQNSLESRFIFAQAEPFPSSTEISLRLSGNATIFGGKAARMHVTMYPVLYQPIYIFVSTAEFTTGAWHHVAFTKDGSAMHLYLDGRQLATQAYSGTTPFAESYGLSIGTSSNSNPNINFFANSPLNGEIDEVRISNSVRYISDFSPPVFPFFSDPETVALYHLDSNGDDASSNGNLARLYGTVLFIPSGIPLPTLLPTPMLIPSPTPDPTPEPTPDPTPILEPTPLPTSVPTPAATHIPSATPIPTKITLNPIADSFVKQKQPNVNYGRHTSLSVDGQPVELTYLKFDLSSLIGKNLLTAQLRFRVNDSSVTRQFIKYVPDNSWGEYSLTFANRPAPTLSVAAIQPLSIVGFWKKVNIMDAVTLAQGQLMTLLIDAQTSSFDSLGIHSRESNSKPQLTITYQ